MRKEEFPTFLNEQPTVVFGRTGRELMIIACGCGLGWAIWVRLGAFHNGLSGLVISIAIIAIPMLLSVVMALISVAGRPLEEWCFVLIFYVMMPKLFLYMPMDEEEQPMSDDELAQEGMVAAPQILLPAGRTRVADEEVDEK